MVVWLVGDIAPLRVQHVGAPRATQYVVTEETRTKKCIVEPLGRCFSSNSIYDEDLNSKTLVCQTAESYHGTMGVTNNDATLYQNSTMEGTQNMVFWQNVMVFFKVQSLRFLRQYSSHKEAAF